MPPTGLVLHPTCLAHDPGLGHPERPDRLRAVLARLEADGLLAACDVLEAPEVAEDAVLAVHPSEHVERLAAACARAPAVLDGDTSVSSASLAAARLAAGGAVEACRRVVAGAWGNAFVAVRPPGHHAERATAMGFCLLNTVAIAARAARRELGAERVAVLDWDVHHGNGTQHLFEEDPTVFYASLHQAPLYPGTGAASERGVGDGEGATRNRPLPPGSGDAAWLRALEEEVLPELDAFRPDLLLVSAGFDAHRLDPLASCDVTEAGFAAMTRLALELARERCGGRLVAVLEGGYHLDALAASVAAHVGELAGTGP